MPFHKHKIVVFAIATGVGCFAFLWFGPLTTVPVRLTFLHCTNDLGSGNVLGVFQLQNDLCEDIEIAGALIQENNGRLCATALQGANCCPSGTNILLAIRMATNRGPSRLQTLYIPDSKLTPKFYHSLRYRFALFASSRRLIPALWFGGRGNATYAEWRLHGIMVVTSPPFSVPILRTNTPRVD
jgi:hypothetical protein